MTDGSWCGFLKGVNMMLDYLVALLKSYERMISKVDDERTVDVIFLDFSKILCSLQVTSSRIT